MNLWEIRTGHYPIYALGSDAECQVMSYIDKLAEDNPAEHKKVVARLDTVAENGPPRNKEQNRPLDHKCYELKMSQTRMAYFWEKNRMIICTMAFPKKGQKTPKRILNQVYDIKRRYDNESTQES